MFVHTRSAEPSAIKQQFFLFLFHAHVNYSTKIFSAAIYISIAIKNDSMNYVLINDFLWAFVLYHCEAFIFKVMFEIIASFIHFNRKVIN